MSCCGSLVKMVVGAGGALVRVGIAAAQGAPVLRTDEERLVIVAICTGRRGNPICPAYNPPDAKSGPRCLDCLCWLKRRGLVPGKWDLATEKCPRGKWPESSNTTDAGGALMVVS